MSWSEATEKALSCFFFFPWAFQLNKQPPFIQVSSHTNGFRSSEKEKSKKKQNKQKKTFPGQSVPCGFSWPTFCRCSVFTLHSVTPTVQQWFHVLPLPNLLHVSPPKSVHNLAPCTTPPSPRRQNLQNSPHSWSCTCSPTQFSLCHRQYCKKKKKEKSKFFWTSCLLKLVVHWKFTPACGCDVCTDACLPLKGVPLWNAHDHQ